uniref:Uncharacterized protein n=1 Tax=Populus alba TaxID=43335 RepID=A0A4U5Q2N7_POPAL|nr:hypothetical protein D5086_0000165740 [Populus alba]
MARQTCGPEERSADEYAPATTMEAGGEQETPEDSSSRRSDERSTVEKLSSKLECFKNQLNLEKFDVHRDVSRDLKVDSSSRRSDELSTVEKLSRKLECFKNQLNLEKFDVHRDVSRDLKVDSSSRRSDEGSTVEKLSRKLERFKNQLNLEKFDVHRDARVKRLEDGFKLTAQC